MKICRKCKKEGEDNLFIKNDRLCKECKKKQSKQYNSLHKEYYKKYYYKNKNKINKLSRERNKRNKKIRKIKKCKLCGFEGDLSLFCKNRKLCKTCKKEMDKNYYELNKENHIALGKKYREQNKKKIKEIKKIYYEENREQILEKKREYAKNNKDKRKKYCIKNKVFLDIARKEYTKNNKEKNKRKKKKYCEKNKDKIRENKRKYAIKNKEKLLENKRKLYKKNKDKIREKQRKYAIKNKDKLKKYYSKKYINNSNYRLSCLLRTGLRKKLRIKNVKKRNSIVESLGCSISFLKSYLEFLFLPNMNWENLGFKNKDENGYYWEIDHIVPFKSVNLENKEDLLKVCHFSNLRPCWGWANGARNFHKDEEIDFNSPIPKYFIKEKKDE